MENNHKGGREVTDESTSGISSTIFEAARGRKPRNLMNEVKDYLRIFATGYEFARIEPAILRDLNLSKKDTVRPQIRKLRMAGIPIASGSSGYWVLPPMPSEGDMARYEDYLGNLENRAIKIFEVRKAQIAAYNKRTGKQLELRKV